MLAAILIVLVILLAVAAAALAWAIRARNMQIWLGSYLRRPRPPKVEGPIHVMFCFVDHFEPIWGKVDLATQRQRVDRWCRDYRAMASRHRDADGRHPQHSFFYPEEEYLEEHLTKIAALVRGRLWRDRDPPAPRQRHAGELPRDDRSLQPPCCTNATARCRATRSPASCASASSTATGSLDNSRADGRWCGINNELILLRELGCYADFTLPSAPSDTQTQHDQCDLLRHRRSLRSRNRTTPASRCASAARPAAT